MLTYERFTEKIGNPPLIILHGLFGSAKNWISVGKDLSAHFDVVIPSARNHGNSFHAATHNLDDLREDLHVLIHELDLKQPILIGHSMGGLTAMDYARVYAESVKALIIIDIAPRSYSPGHENEIAAQMMDVSRFETRPAIDQAMSQFVSDPMIRQFLQMNIARDASGKYIWQNNIHAIERSRKRTTFPQYDPPLYLGPALFFRGLKSDYIHDEDVERMKNSFPQLTLVEVEGAGHWLHYTHRDLMMQKINEFLAQPYFRM